MRAIRRGLQGAGIPVENSKGEWGPGQEEINVRYADALEMADRHAILKNAVKEIAHAQGKAVTFMAKWRYDLAGSSSHVHLSLWDEKGAKPLFHDAKAEHGMSPLMRAFVAGQIKYARDITYFLAPYINSYKRFQVGTFAPTKTVWSRDNRTAGFRLCGEGSKAIRIECRIGGADLNPYLAFAALIAAGLRGVEEKLALEPPFSGDAYVGKTLPEVPKTLREATQCLAESKLLREALRRRRGRALRAHGQVGAARVRPPHHRLGADAGVRAVLRAERAAWGDQEAQVLPVCPCGLPVPCRRQRGSIGAGTRRHALFRRRANHGWQCRQAGQGVGIPHRRSRAARAAVDGAHQVSGDAAVRRGEPDLLHALQRGDRARPRHGRAEVALRPEDRPGTAARQPLQLPGRGLLARREGGRRRSLPHAHLHGHERCAGDRARCQDWRALRRFRHQRRDQARRRHGARVAGRVSDHLRACRGARRRDRRVGHRRQPSRRRAAGTVRAYDARTGRLRWTWDPLRDANIEAGHANVWAPMSVDEEARARVLADLLAEPRLLGRQAARQQRACQLGGGAAGRDGRARLGVPGRASRRLGLRHAGPADARAHRHRQRLARRR